MGFCIAIFGTVVFALFIWMFFLSGVESVEALLNAKKTCDGVVSFEEFKALVEKEPKAYVLYENYFERKDISKCFTFDSVKDLKEYKRMCRKILEQQQAMEVQVKNKQARAELFEHAGLDAGGVSE